MHGKVLKGMLAMRLVWAIAALSLFGCTTMATVAPADMPAVIEKLRAGDRVALLTAAGWHQELRIVGVDSANIRAQSPSGPIAFARADVTGIQVRRAAPGKTAALAAGIYVLGQTALCGNPFRRNDGC